MRRQRRRWIAAQLFLGCQMIRHIPMALVHGNGDYLLKTIQALILPRSILVGFIGIISVTISILSPLSSIKWWFLLILLTVSLYLAIPSPMRHKYMGRLVKQIPVFIVSMIFNLFHLKGMAHKFTHTQHG